MSRWMDDWDEANGYQPGKPWTEKKKGYKNWKRCWEDHKPLALGGGTVLGAACAHPQEGYDIYIGFDHGMEFQNSIYPWSKDEEQVVEFLFPITDMCAPKSPKEFGKMVDWMQEQLAEGKKIQMGCIGGHGRTGLVLAALYAQVTGKKNAIQWVRKHHCKKGVESTSQVKFLMKHFGVSKVEPTKGVSTTTTGSHKGASSGYQKNGTTTYGRDGGRIVVDAVKNSGSIW